MSMAYTVVIFLAQWVVVSLSGVMAPGPATAATVAAGMRRQHAGTWIAVGHGLVEFPLAVLVVLGSGLFKSPSFRIGVGLAGGAILLLLAGLTLAALRRPVSADAPQPKSANPIWTGVIVTGGNPYFLFWWATVGLAMATQAMELGLLVFILFLVIHWLCDLIWLEVLSQASYKGVALYGAHAQRILMVVCAATMGGFGLWFIYDAGRGLIVR